MMMWTGLGPAALHLQLHEEQNRSARTATSNTSPLFPGTTRTEKSFDSAAYAASGTAGSFGNPEAFYWLLDHQWGATHPTSFATPIAFPLSSYESPMSPPLSSYASPLPGP
eukprot:3260049-Rhodomonas_salina.2